jgi:hypothetical protein
MDTATAPIPTTNGQTPPVSERITPEDLAYLQKCLAQWCDAKAVLEHWGAFMTARYKCGPSDRINDDGTIERGVVDVGAGG